MDSIKTENPVRLKERLAQQQAYFTSKQTLSYEFRVKQLKKLKAVLLENKHQLVDALFQDLGRPEFEAKLELAMLFHELNDTIRHLKKWMRVRKVATGLFSQPGKSRIESCPLGNILILGPYNYPLILTLQPLLGALAAGNTAVVLPSESTPVTTQKIIEMLATTFSPQYVFAAVGSVERITDYLEYKFDHIFFTGSARVGRIVMAAAAKHLTPVTLELGGKTPTIIDKNCDLDLAVKRIASGKFLNAGQTCIAPDHVFVHREVKDQFLGKLKSCIVSFYGESAQHSPDFGRLVNHRHFKRVSNLIGDAKILVGGETDEASKFIAPTVLYDVSMADGAMQQEIFGPVLPVLDYASEDELIGYLNQLPQHPLAMYIFTRDRQFEQRLISQVRCGGVNVNSTLMHCANGHLPFGGVGESGIGSYHGKHSFTLFSHAKSVVNSATWLDLPFRYAPYGNKAKWLDKLIS